LQRIKKNKLEELDGFLEAKEELKRNLVLPIASLFPLIADFY